MIRNSRLIALGAVAGGLFVALTAAQAQPAAKRSDVLGNIQAAIVTTVGAEGQSVKVTSGGTVLIVARVNSNMNDATHEGRNNEAKAIAALVAKGIGSELQFRKIMSIRVDYLARSGPTMKSKTIDSVEFRKDPDGAFGLHQT
jgi:hypothetical protein